MQTTTNNYRVLNILLDIVKNRKDIRHKIEELDLFVENAELIIGNEKLSNKSSLIHLYFRSNELKKDIRLIAVLRLLNREIEKFDEIPIDENEYYIGSSIYYDFETIVNYYKSINHACLDTQIS